MILATMSKKYLKVDLGWNTVSYFLPSNIGARNLHSNHKGRGKPLLRFVAIVTKMPRPFIGTLVFFHSDYFKVQVWVLDLGPNFYLCIFFFSTALRCCNFVNSLKPHCALFLHDSLRTFKLCLGCWPRVVSMFGNIGDNGWKV